MNIQAPITYNFSSALTPAQIAEARIHWTLEGILDKMPEFQTLLYVADEELRNRYHEGSISAIEFLTLIRL